MRLLALASMLACMLGCGREDDRPAIDPSASLFGADVIAKLDLELDPAAIAALDAEPKVYVPGDLTMTIGDEQTVLTNIGVRLKGAAGSFRTLDQKPAFLLDFDRYVAGQRLLELDKLAVNNMVQDPSMEREQLAYLLFRDVGVPAPRSGPVVVTVNGEDYGLHVAIESIDNHRFLIEWFGSDQGSVYEGGFGCDLYPELVTSFDQDNGADVGYADLAALVATLDAIAQPEDFMAEVDAVLDIELFLTFVATETYLGQSDGYTFNRNNFYVARRGDDQRWVLIPWGLDWSMHDAVEPFGGTGRLAQMCAASLACRQRLAATIVDVAARADALDLPARAEALAELLHDAAAADPRREYSLEAVESAVADNVEFLRGRSEAVLAGLICTDPSAVDDDGDGHDGCVSDCNDADPAIHPDATELCNLVDEDCNGLLDDDPACPQCVVEPLPGSGQAAVCFAARDRAAAAAECVAQGGHLISIHDQATHDAVITGAFSLPGDGWWIGLGDAQTEGAFAWTDGSTLDFTRWATGQPDNDGDEDCVQIFSWTFGEWIDVACDVARPYVCGLP